MEPLECQRDGSRERVRPEGEVECPHESFYTSFTTVQPEDTRSRDPSATSAIGQAFHVSMVDLIHMGYSESLF